MLHRKNYVCKLFGSILFIILVKRNILLCSSLDEIQQYTSKFEGKILNQFDYIYMFSVRDKVRE